MSTRLKFTESHLFKEAQRSWDKLRLGSREADSTQRSRIDGYEEFRIRFGVYSVSWLSWKFHERRQGRQISDERTDIATDFPGAGEHPEGWKIGHGDTWAASKAEFEVLAGNAKRCFEY
jgi:hypothetical protein